MAVEGVAVVDKTAAVVDKSHPIDDKIETKNIVEEQSVRFQGNKILVVDGMDPSEVANKRTDIEDD